MKIIETDTSLDTDQIFSPITVSFFIQPINVHCWNLKFAKSSYYSRTTCSKGIKLKKSKIRLPVRYLWPLIQDGLFYYSSSFALVWKIESPSFQSFHSQNFFSIRLHTNELNTQKGTMKSDEVKNKNHKN